MKYELLKTNFGLPKTLFDVVTDKDGNTTETPTNKMFIPIDLQIKDTVSINPNPVFSSSLIVEFEKTLSIGDVETLCEEEITKYMTKINK